MEATFEDCYVVYLRKDQRHDDWPEMAERPLASCASYDDARKLCQKLHEFSWKSVIRFQGMTGGGD
jgi:hypothetical protein